MCIYKEFPGPNCGILSLEGKNMGTTGRLKEELKCEILGIAFVALGVLYCLLFPFPQD